MKGWRRLERKKFVLFSSKKINNKNKTKKLKFQNKPLDQGIGEAERESERGMEEERTVRVVCSSRISICFRSLSARK